MVCLIKQSCFVNEATLFKYCCELHGQFFLSQCNCSFQLSNITKGADARSRG